MKNFSKNKKRNTIEISLVNGSSEEKICDIKWDKERTPLIVSKQLEPWHYHHYYKNGELTAHLRNNKTGEKIEAEAGISNSVSEIVKKLKQSKIV
ncbi:MAG: hypothetical protein AABY06_02815 [Nanoarchaeota archaeon]